MFALKMLRISLKWCPNKSQRQLRVSETKFKVSEEIFKRKFLIFKPVFFKKKFLPLTTISKTDDYNKTIFEMIKQE